MSVSGAGLPPMGADMMRVRTTSSGKQVSIAVTPVVAGDRAPRCGSASPDAEAAHRYVSGTLVWQTARCGVR
jgi:hypothetical protein